MAHRTQYSKDIYLPKQIQQQRVVLQKQIQKVRQRQQLLTEQNDQKLLLLEKRLIYGKKKIFAFDQQINRMTLGDQISHYNLEIKRLNQEIAEEQKNTKEENQDKDKKPKEYLVGGKEHMGMRESLQNRESINQTNIINKQINPKEQLHSPLNPHQQLLCLTHEIMRLKKSLQQVRSKYSDNFTEYKLKQQSQKLKEQNDQIAQQLKLLQQNKKLLNQTISAANMSDVDYDQLEIVRAKKEFQSVQRQRNLLRDYCNNLEREEEDRKQTDQVRLKMFREEKIARLKNQIDQVLKQNHILGNQIQLTSNQMQRCYSYQQQLAGRTPYS